MPQVLRNRGCNYRYHAEITTNGVSTNKVQTSYRVTWQDGVTGSSLPNFKQIIRAGGNATTGFSAFETTKKSIPVTAKCHIKGPKSGPPSTDKYFTVYDSDSDRFPAGDPQGLSASSPDILAREQFLQKYRQTRRSMMIGVSLGELRQTVQMIARPAQALRSEVLRARESAKRRVRGLRGPQAAKAIADSWLEYQYGWKSLIGDIKDAAKLASVCPARFREVITAQSENTWESDRVDTSYAFTGVTYPYWRAVAIQNNTSRVRYKGAVSTSITPPSFPEQLGLSWSSVLPTIWELIPYSFLIDYFSNVGQVIEGISMGSVGLSWGCRSEKRQTSKSFQATIDAKTMQNVLGSSYEWSGNVNGGGIPSTRKVVVRTPVYSVGIGLADLDFRLPGRDSLKWLNLAGLAVARAADRRSAHTRL